MLTVLDFHSTNSGLVVVLKRKAIKNCVLGGCCWYFFYIAFLLEDGFTLPHKKQFKPSLYNIKLHIKGQQVSSQQDLLKQHTHNQTVIEFTSKLLTDYQPYDFMSCVLHSSELYPFCQIYPSMLYYVAHIIATSQVKAE